MIKNSDKEIKYSIYCGELVLFCDLLVKNNSNLLNYRDYIERWAHENQHEDFPFFDQTKSKVKDKLIIKRPNIIAHSYIDYFPSERRSKIVLKTDPYLKLNNDFIDIFDYLKDKFVYNRYESNIIFLYEQYEVHYNDRITQYICLVDLKNNNFLSINYNGNFKTINCNHYCEVICSVKGTKYKELEDVTLEYILDLLRICIDSTITCAY